MTGIYCDLINISLYSHVLGNGRRVGGRSSEEDADHRHRP